MISVIVVTKDEENMIRACLESVKWAAEIIVYDNGSTDKTLEIAKKYTDKIYKYEGQDYAELRNRAMEKTAGDWVLYVDADERVLEPLKKEIIGLTANSDKSAFAISRRNIIFGREERYGPFWPDWIIRLYKKSEFKGWVGKIHEHGTFRGKLGYTKNSFIHLTHRDVDQIVTKSLNWSNFDAKLRLELNHPKMSGLRFLRIFITEIFYQGIIRRGFFSGTIGIMDSLLQAFSLFITYIKLWELQQQKPLNQTYDEIDKKLIDSGFKY